MESTIEENFIYEVVNNKKSFLRTAKRMKLSVKESTDIIIKNGLQDTILKRFEPIVEDVVGMYKKCETVNETCDRLNISDKSKISSILRLSGFTIDPSYHKGRDSKIDHHYLDTIDDEYKAYYLGFMYADGYNVYSNKKYQISLELQARDIEILQKFKEMFKSTYDIGDKMAMSPSTGKMSPIKRLIFYSKDLSLRLKDLGCIEAKTYDIEFPSEDIIPDHLIRHFIRGYSDGDGSICINEKSYRNTISIQGTQSFLNELMEKVVSYTGTTKTKILNGNGNVFEWKKGGRKQVLKVLDWLYKDSNIYLERKYDKYMQIKNLNRRTKQ